MTLMKLPPESVARGGPFKDVLTLRLEADVHNRFEAETG
jgi:hypothetical protein